MTMTVNDKINAIKHQDKRANIPTNELRGFVAEEESVPKSMLYPRDPSLDPQLVWKGKARVPPIMRCMFFSSFWFDLFR